MESGSGPTEEGPEPEPTRGAFDPEVSDSSSTGYRVTTTGAGLEAGAVKFPGVKFPIAAARDGLTLTHMTVLFLSVALGKRTTSCWNVSASWDEEEGEEGEEGS